MIDARVSVVHDPVMFLLVTAPYRTGCKYVDGGRNLCRVPPECRDVAGRWGDCPDCWPLVWCGMNDVHLHVAGPKYITRNQNSSVPCARESVMYDDQVVEDLGLQYVSGDTVCKLPSRFCRHIAVLVIM